MMKGFKRVSKYLQSWASQDFDNEVTSEFVHYDPGIEVQEYQGSARGWMQTYQGRKFYPLDPYPEDVDIVDIAHGLAMTCRFGGQCREFYSVAEHCVHVARALEHMGYDGNVLRAGLLHDSAEAYIGDLIRPLKHQPEMIEFRKAEAKIELAVAERFKLDTSALVHGLVKNIDNRILVDEIRQLCADPEMYLPAEPGLQPLGITLHCWTPARAEQEFLLEYRRLFLHAT